MRGLSGAAFGPPFQTSRRLPVDSLSGDQPTMDGWSRSAATTACQSSRKLRCASGSTASKHQLGYSAHVR